MLSINYTYQLGLIGNYPTMNKTSGSQERKTAGILSKNKIFEISTTEWSEIHFFNADQSLKLYKLTHVLATHVAHSKHM